MEASQRTNLIFLDACRDNPFSRKLMQGMDTSRSVLIGRGLAPFNSNAGTLISYATKDGEVAEDGTEKHSPYTRALLNQIEQPGVEISRMLRKVRMEVMTVTGKKQTPWEYGSLLGDFYFIGTTAVQTTDTVSPAINTNVEALYWQSIMNENTPEVFNQYLKKYPQGEFAELAKHKISILTKGSDTPSGAAQKQQISRSNPSDFDRSSSEELHAPVPVSTISPTMKTVLVAPFENLSPVQNVVSVSRTFGLYDNPEPPSVKLMNIPKHPDRSLKI
jgi:hypothetical protein